MFIKYDKNGDGYLTKEQTYDYIKEIDALVKNEDQKQESIRMTPMQFEQLFKVMDENGDNTIEPCEIESLLQAYEMWNYEHTYKQTMEELYGDIDQ